MYTQNLLINAKTKGSQTLLLLLISQIFSIAKKVLNYVGIRKRTIYASIHRLCVQIIYRCVSLCMFVEENVMFCAPLSVLQNVFSLKSDIPTKA